MKKLFVEAKWREQAKRRHNKEFTRRQTHKLRLERRQKGYVSTDDLILKQPKLKRRTHTLKAPGNFSFINNTVEMIMFFNQISEETRQGHNVAIDLREIKRLTTDALIVLLSKANEAKFARGMHVNSNTPNDSELKKVFMGSGVLQYIEENNYRIRPAHGAKRVEESGHVYRKKSYEVEPRMAKDLITFATEKLYGERSRRKGIQRTLIECMNNTINHAALEDTKEETWWATVYCDEVRKKAYFTFTDNGVGIFESIKVRDLKKQFALKVGLKNNAELLREILRGEIGSRTGLSYRGNGLPRIREVAERGQVGNLIIISNNVYSNVSKNEYTTMPFPFEGTFFHWEMTDV